MHYERRRECLRHDRALHVAAEIDDSGGGLQTV